MLTSIWQLLENREMNLEDGTLIVSQERYQLYVT